MELLNQKIEQAAKLISQATNIVAMTGAGISTASGIPDLGSSHIGLWDHIDPITVASIHVFRQNPQQFYNWIRPFSRLFLEAEPNPAHYALVALEHMSKVRAIVTQNIDNLHAKAGSKNVFELHGTLREVICMQCDEAQASTSVFEQFLRDGQVPRHDCGGVLKPNVLLFGESLAIREYALAQQAVGDADLVLIIGSSLEVMPVSNLPDLALEKGTKMIIVNHKPVYLDQKADVVIHADATEVLPRIVKSVVAAQGFKEKSIWNESTCSIPASGVDGGSKSSRTEEEGLQTDETLNSLATLSPERRALLALRLGMKDQKKSR